jgi:hypothetical protein
MNRFFVVFIHFFLEHKPLPVKRRIVSASAPSAVLNIYKKRLGNVYNIERKRAAAKRKSLQENQKAKNSQRFYILISKSTREKRSSAYFDGKSFVCPVKFFFFSLTIQRSFLVRWVSIPYFFFMLPFFLLEGEMKRKLRPTCVFRRRMPFALDGLLFKKLSALFSAQQMWYHHHACVERNI